MATSCPSLDKGSRRDSKKERKKNEKKHFFEGALPSRLIRLYGAACLGRNHLRRTRTIWTLETGWASKAMFTHDGRSILACLVENTGSLLEFDVENPGITREIKISDDFIRDFYVSSQTDFIAVCCTSKKPNSPRSYASIWNNKENFLIGSIPLQFAGFIDISHDQSRLAIGGVEIVESDTLEIVNIYDIQTLDLIKRIDLKNDFVSGVTYSPDGRFLAIGSSFYDFDEYQVRSRANLYDANTLELIHVFENEPGGIKDIQFSPNGRYLGVAHDPSPRIDYRGRVSIWDTESLILKTHFDKINTSYKQILNIDFSKDSRKLYIGCGESVDRENKYQVVLQIWDIETNELERGIKHLHKPRLNKDKTKIIIWGYQLQLFNIDKIDSIKEPLGNVERFVFYNNYQIFYELNVVNYSTANIELIDLNGNLVFSKKLNSSQGSIDVSHLNNGTFLYNLYLDGNPVYSNKFVIAR